MKKILLALALLLPSFAIADDVKLDWVAPIERENNKPLLPTEIQGYTIRDTFDGTVTNIPDGTATSFNFTDVPVGVHVYDIRVTDTAGRFSQWSSQVIMEIFNEVILPPKSPTLSGTVLPVVY